ncbi:hypothetical protein BMF94_2666 [Rhodotorula taiwanensis]|uniref:Uncharacterized protein n=1 Tax=Rhodotorula taiwanensis TaxID=741276 RepID=A0A2S5BBU2_9BASI|nr:hypothetical protein BMF94_2666 [Rhodotorula taiwanensis]
MQGALASTVFLPDSVRKLVIAVSRDSLKALSLVSKHWHSLVEPALWSRLDYKPKPLAELADASLNLIQRIGMHVRTFTATRWYLSADFHPIMGAPAEEEQALAKQSSTCPDVASTRILRSNGASAWPSYRTR